MKRLIIILFLAFLAAASYGKRKAEEPIILNKEDVLHVIVIDSMYDFGSNDRFYHFENSFNELMEEIDFPMAYTIDEFGARLPKDQPIVQLTIGKWEANRWGEIEVRLSAYMRDPLSGNRNKLGFHVERDQKILFTGGSYQERQYNDVLKKALLKLIRRIEEHIPSQIEYLDPEATVQADAADEAGEEQE